MRYSEFCNNFYFKRNAGGLTGRKSQWKIAEYFLKLALKDAELECILPDSNSGYEKYFTGARKPEAAIWQAVIDYFDNHKFLADLMENLNANLVEEVAANFGLRLKDEPLSKELFAVALMKQFYAIANGNGEAENIVSTEYREAMRPKEFPIYIEKATDKYRRIDALTGGSEVRLLKEYYVCNPITTSASRSRAQGSSSQIIENVTAEKIGEISNRVILIGNGGCGKTLMLQHLFVDSVEKYASSGVLPIIVELREFRFQNKNLLGNIVNAVRMFDDSFTETEARRLMAAGKCLLLLDGADEIDPGDIDEFKIQLSGLLDKYSAVQVVVTSRECEIVKAFSYYGHLYLLPFSKKESLELIDKILNRPEDAMTKRAVLAWLDSDFLKEHERLVSNPMLLTNIVKQYPLPDDKDKTFYQSVYDAIVTGHDNEKWGYKRIFHSAANAEEFTEVFREFCAKSYRKCMFEFEATAFENIFKRLVTKNRLVNPNSMNKKTFIHDACVTACMMYEEKLNYFYFDNGFQEFLFAQYYYLDEPENVEKMGRSLWRTPASAFGGYSAFRMLYDFSADKVEVCLFMPFLKEIFEGKTDEEAYEAFFIKGYSKISVTSWERQLIEKYEQKQGAKSRFGKGLTNEPSTVILSLIIVHLGIQQDFQVSLQERLPDSAAVAVASVITGEMAYDSETKEDIISMRRLGQNDVENWKDYQRTHSVGEIIMDEDGNVVCFGYEYDIDLRERQRKRLAKYAELILALYDEKNNVRKTYKRIKLYYEMLMEKHSEKVDGNF